MRNHNKYKWTTMINESKDYQIYFFKTPTSLLTHVNQIRSDSIVRLLPVSTVMKNKC